MVPSNFAFLDSLPLTPNGKVNHDALPPVDQSWPELTESFVMPRTDLEASLAKIWSELLKLNTVGVHDNFFDLGGHSLLVTQMISRVRQTFQVELPVRAIFEKPTIVGLVERINQNQAHVVADVLADIESLSSEEAQELAVKETPG
jgi:acyl carrier protein